MDQQRSSTARRARPFDTPPVFPAVLKGPTIQTLASARELRTRALRMCRDEFRFWRLPRKLGEFSSRKTAFASAERSLSDAARGRNTPADPLSQPGRLPAHRFFVRQRALLDVRSRLDEAVPLRSYLPRESRMTMRFALFWLPHCAVNRDETRQGTRSR